MKRFLAFVLVVVLAFSVTVASASAIKIKGLSEKALYGSMRLFPVCAILPPVS